MRKLLSERRGGKEKRSPVAPNQKKNGGMYFSSRRGGKGEKGEATPFLTQTRVKKGGWVGGDGGLWWGGCVFLQSTPGGTKNPALLHGAQVGRKDSLSPLDSPREKKDVSSPVEEGKRRNLSI